MDSENGKSDMSIWQNMISHMIFREKIQILGCSSKKHCEYCNVGWF
jgi:hypothetical protein